MANKTFDHVLLTVFGFKTSSDAYKCLLSNQISNAFAIASLEKADIESLFYTEDDDEGNPAMKIIPIYQRRSIWLLGELIRKIKQEELFGVLLTEEDILAISKSQYDNFCIMALLSSISPATITTPTPSVISPSPYKKKEVLSFRKSVKGDKTQYPELEDERNYENGKRSFLAVARTHGIEDVFDVSYSPMDDEAKELFQEQLKFAYSLLDAVLKTDMGKMLVGRYLKKFNAQRILREFTEYAEASTKAQLHAQQLLTWITSAKYDNTWKGNAQSFILYWMNKIMG